MTAPAVIFHVGLYHGIWQVTLDGAFYGQYRSRDVAHEGAEAGAAALRAAGRDAKIVMLVEEADVRNGVRDDRLRRP